MQYVNAILLIILILAVLFLLKRVKNNSRLIGAIGEETDGLRKDVDCHDRTFYDIENHLGVEFDSCDDE